MSFPTTWTPIAYRMHDDHQWRPIPGALLTMDAARKLEASGEILRAQRRDHDCTALLIRGKKVIEIPRGRT